VAKVHKIIVVFLIAYSSIGIAQEDKKILFRSNDGFVSFTSDAPLEIIKAESKELKGIIDPDKRTFAFQLSIKSLKGFNSPLQQEHFYENYMETEKYPNAMFSGKIIESLDFSSPGDIKIRAKGELEIHGVKTERIINCSLKITERGFTVTSDFTVLLKDHNISIPKLVYQKIAEEIRVNIRAEFEKVEMPE